MHDLLSACLRLSGDRRGVTAIEYALMAVLIAMAIIVAVTRVGTRTLSLWTSVTSMQF